MLVEVNLTGGTYEHESRELTNQQTRNFWPQQIASPKSRSPYVLRPFYGMKAFSTQSGAKDRGMLENQGVLYKVTDTTFYRVASDGTQTSLGTIPGSNRCIMKPMGSQIIIVNGSGDAYVWDGTSLSLVTDANIGDPRGVAVVNNQAIYDAGAGQGFDVSNVGVPGTINALNNASAESVPDGLLIPYGYRENLYLMGTKSIEPWWNSGQGNPPFEKFQGGVINIGLGSIYSPADNPDFIFLLGSDRRVHSLTGGTSIVDAVISTPALDKAIERFSVIEDAIGWTMQLQGQWFYVLKFPIEDKTYVFPIGGEPFEWGAGTVGRTIANSFADVYGKKLVADENSGNIYELDALTFTDVGNTIVRTRVTAPIHGGLFKMQGSPFEIQAIEIILEAGVGILNGQGSNPEIMISLSKDGGKSFGTQRFIKTGRLGDTRRKVIAKNFGRFTGECVIKIECSDPIFWSIFSATAYIEFGE